MLYDSTWGLPNGAWLFPAAIKVCWGPATEFDKYDTPILSDRIAGYVEAAQREIRAGGRAIVILDSEDLVPSPGGSDPKRDAGIVAKAHELCDFVRGIDATIPFGFYGAVPSSGSIDYDNPAAEAETERQLPLFFRDLPTTHLNCCGYWGVNTTISTWCKWFAYQASYCASYGKTLLVDLHPNYIDTLTPLPRDVWLRIVRFVKRMGLGVSAWADLREPSTSPTGQWVQDVRDVMANV
jgi:hypothetical protein